MQFHRGPLPAMFYVSAVLTVFTSQGAAVTLLRGAQLSPSSNVSAPAATPHRARLDVGFANWEKDMAVEVTRSIDSHLRITGWSDGLRKKLAANVSALFRTEVDKELKPLKQNIGKTWMVLPEERQKDEFVDQLRSGFASLFASSMHSLGSHANTSLTRFATVAAAAKRADSEEQRLMGAREALADSILKDHCYDEPKGSVHHAKNATVKAGKAAAAALLAEAPAPPGQFCIKSLLHGLIRRLRDSEELASMTMKFDARALAMVQQKKLQSKL